MRQTIDQIRAAKLAALKEDQKPAPERTPMCGAHYGSALPLVVCTREYGHLEGMHVSHNAIFEIVAEWNQTEIEALEVILENAGMPRDILIGRPPAAQIPTRRPIVKRVSMLIESETKLARYAGDMWQLAWRQRDTMKELVDLMESGATIVEPSAQKKFIEITEKMGKYVVYKPEFLVGVGHKMTNFTDGQSNYCLNCGAAMGTDVIAPCRQRK